MPLGRPLAAVSARGIRRTLSTAAAATDSRRRDWRSWYLLSRTTPATGQAPGPAVRFANPPSLSHLHVPENLAKHSGGVPLPDPDDDVMRLLGCQACCTSHDGLLLLNVQDFRVAAPILARQGADQGGNHVRRLTGVADPRQLPGMTHYVFNPYNREISSRIPEIEGPKKILAGFNLGLFTQANAGRPGPPDRYAVAEMEAPLGLMLRFLSETGEWEIVQGSPCQLPAGRRRLVPNQEAVAWGGRLWWVDLTFGAICADPFSDRPEPHFVQLPSGSVLSEEVRQKGFDEVVRRGSNLSNVCWNRQPEMFRRVGVSGGWLQYVEVSQEEPFVLSSFKLDADGSGWTLDHRVALSTLWADGGHPWLPLLGEMTPQIGALDRANANVVYINVGYHIVCVDLHKGEVTGHCPYGNGDRLLPCVLTSWLPTTRIPGKKDVTKKNTLADVLVRLDRCQEK